MWPSEASARSATPKFSAPASLTTFTPEAAIQAFPSDDATLNAVLAWASTFSPFSRLGEEQQLRDMTMGYCLALWRADYLND